MKPYPKLCAGLSKMVFTLTEAQKVLGAKPSSAKVIVSRLKRAGQILPLGRGEYRLIKPENLSRLLELKKMNPKLYQLALGLYQRYPDLKLLVLYGSQVTGSADFLSDYDTMVITETLHDRREEKNIRRELENELGIKLHLTVYSERGFKILAMTEPHLRFWLNEGVMLEEGIALGPLPPVARWGYREALYLAEGYIDIGDQGGVASVASYLIALKITLIVEHALNLDYSYENVRKEIEALVGRDFLLAVRKDRFSPRGLRKRQIEELKRAVREKLRKVRAKLNLIGENESDLRWKELRKR